MTTGFVMLIVFLFMAILMYFEKISTMLVLPLMAVLFAIIAVTSNFIKDGIPETVTGLSVVSYVFSNYSNLISDIFAKGAVKLAPVIITTIFGGMLAIYIKNLKIAEKMIYWTAEFAGDKPFIIGLALFIVTFLLFTSIGGLGSVIMVGAIILPILSSVGIPPVASAGIFLIGICAGGTINPGNLKLYMETFGISQTEVIRFARLALLVYLVCGLAWMAVTIRKSTMSNFWAVKIPAEKVKLSPLSFLAPIVPVILVFFFKVDPIMAFILSLTYTLLISLEKGAIRLFCKSLIEGAQAVMPASILMIGIGMLLQCVLNEQVNVHLNPILSKVIPHTWISYVIGFGLCAPLALYRGPLNVWGLGFGLGTLIFSSGILPREAVMGMLISVGMIQGVCDPTNTHNVWIASYQGITPNKILRKTLPFVWVAAVMGLAISAYLYVGLGDGIMKLFGK